MGATNNTELEKVSLEDLETRFEGRKVYVEFIEDADTEDYLLVTNDHGDELVIFAKSVTEDEVVLPVNFATLTNSLTAYGRIDEVDVKADFDEAHNVADLAYAIARNML